jgi:hypothetical protein
VDHPAQAQVQAKAAQRPQAGSQPVNLEVALEGFLADAPG